MPFDAYGNTRSDGPICDVLIVEHLGLGRERAAANAEFIIRACNSYDNIRKDLEAANRHAAKRREQITSLRYACKLAADHILFLIRARAEAVFPARGEEVARNWIETDPILLLIRMVTDEQR
jgi:hypothetical protein